MFGRNMIAALLSAFVIVSGNLFAQGVTFLIKGKVVDQKKNALQGVLVYAKDGDDIAGKSKTTVNGEFTLTLKPGKNYVMSFERSDIFVSQQDLRLPNGTSYQEITRDFQIKVFAKGDTIQQHQVFSSGQSTPNSSNLFTTLPEMLKKLQHLKVKIIVAAGAQAKNASKGKKEKTPKKSKGSKNKTQSTPVELTLVQSRIQALRNALLSAGLPESRMVFEEGKLNGSIDVAVVVSSISGGF